MKFDENLSAIHSYLCADGYVIKNPLTQKNKYYYIGFRNTNLTLLKDFQKRFKNYFKIVPRLKEGERCIVQNKKLYEKLINEFGSFYSREWKMPRLNKNLLHIWLRAFFDCEGWVFCRSHQNRHIGLDSINEKGLDEIIDSLKKFGISSIKKINKKRNIFRILIYGKKNLQRFKKEIDFLHPDKKEKLNRLIEDFVVYEWNFPSDLKSCKKFIDILLKEKIRIKKPYFLRIISNTENNLTKMNHYLNKFYLVEGRVSKRTNGLGNIYYELNINRKKDILKLIAEGIVKLNAKELKCLKKN